MLLGNLLKSVGKKYQKITVKGICFDSRRLKKGDVFFSIKGNNTSGNHFVTDVIKKGASAIISNKELKYKKQAIPILLVKNVRKSLAEASSNLYTKKPKNIIAVTGTNGKTSVADFFYQILEFNNIPVASIGTLGIFSRKYKKKTNLTSIDPPSLHKALHKLKKKGIDHVVLEASSHGLKQKRLDNLNINIGIFTNLSHDHLDYHKNLNSYLKAKMHLFNNLLKKKRSLIITDEDIKEFKILKKISHQKKIQKFTIGTNAGSIVVLNIRYKKNKQFVRILIKSKILTLEIPLIGSFQIKNLLMAVLAASKCGISIKKIFNQIKEIKPVKGRLETIGKINNNSSILIDFAHTPEALEKSLIALKKQFNKKILLVFGCGGDRDKTKRLKMGKIAKKYCRKVFVTDDNPRGEDPKKIRNSIIKGCKGIAINIGGREKAIKAAIDDLGQNELLLVAGKGHEETQSYKNKIINFSDRKIIKNIIYKNRKYFNKKNYKKYILKKTFGNNNIQNLDYSGISINTKNIKKNNLFFAIEGKKNDGHKFVKEAMLKGAIKTVVNKKVKMVPKSKIIKVKNTFLSLNDLAKVTRDNCSAKIIGITGSVGKTTLKNLTSFCLKDYGKVYHSPHSYNNKFGVPLSISNLKSNTKYGIFEIGMDKKGEIDNLSKIVRPDIGIITNIGKAHFKNFSSLKNIAMAKSEIIQHITDQGTIILDKDEKFFKYFSNISKKRQINIISFSSKKTADIQLLKIISKNKLKIKVKNEIFYFFTKNITNNFIKNILACISLLFVLNLKLRKMYKKIENFKIPSGRGDINTGKIANKKFKFMDESYNANPLSMKSAIKNVSNYKRLSNSKKIIFLGDMLELGKKSANLHKELSFEINKSDIDKVFVYGKYIKETYNFLSLSKKGKVFSNLKEAHNHLGKIINNNDLLMVKGSNATGLNKFSQNIKKGINSVI